MTDKPKVQVTDVDREAYLAFNNMPAGIADAVRAGRYDSLTGMQILARHRIAAEQSRDDVIEECARALKWFVDRKWTLQSKFDLHGPADTAKAMRDNLKRSEEALRAMKGNTASQSANGSWRIAMTIKNPPAFPSHAGDPEMSDPRNQISCGGMTLRDYFAGQALTTCSLSDSPQAAQWVSRRCYEFANAMLAARMENSDG